MSGGAKKLRNLSFMPDPLTAEEKRDVDRRSTQWDPVVFVGPTASTRKSKAKECSVTKPIVFVNSAFSMQRPRQNINATFGFSSHQRKQRTGLGENKAAVSKKETPACSTIHNRTKDVPAQRKHKGKVPTEEPKKQQEKLRDLISCFTTLINGLTPETLQESVRQLKELSSETEEEVKSVISIIYEMALLRPSSSGLYATICQSLLKIRVSRNTDPTASVSFRKLLVKHCKKQFQVNHSKAYVLEDRQRRLGTATAEEELWRFQNELEASKRSLNNIRFLCELFKAKVLSVAVIHVCITTLLDNRDEESLDYACELFKTIEKDLELETAKQEMDTQFNGMETIGKQGKTSSTVCPLLKDTAELTETNWLSVIAEKSQKDRYNQQTPSLPTKQAQTGDKTKTISKEIIYRYTVTKNLNEALQHVAELNPSLLHVFVGSAADLTLASSSNIRKSVGLLLQEMHKEGLLSAAQVIEGLGEVLEMAENISFSLPEVWLSLAELISPILHPGGVSMAHFHGQILTHVSLRHVTELLRHIISQLCNRKLFCATATSSHPLSCLPYRRSSSLPHTFAHSSANNIV